MESLHCSPSVMVSNWQTWEGKATSIGNQENDLGRNGGGNCTAVDFCHNCFDLKGLEKCIHVVCVCVSI